MTGTALDTPVILTPTGDRAPVERAVVDGMVDDFEPETFLWIVFNRPDGGANLWKAWTAGGPTLGDQADRTAIAAAMDAADWFTITNRYVTQHTRGRIEISAHPLRPILGDVQAGRGDTGDYRDKLVRFAAYIDPTNHPVADERHMPWLGVGPDLYRRRSR